jgi:hypothetical protein
MTDPNSMHTGAMARLLPYNYSTKEILKDGKPTEFGIPDVYAEADRVPLLAQVVGGIVTVLGLLIQEKTLKEQIAAGTSAGIDVTALTASLASVETALGITT